VRACGHLGRGRVRWNHARAGIGVEHGCNFTRCPEKPSCGAGALRILDDAGAARGERSMKCVRCGEFIEPEEPWDLDPPTTAGCSTSARRMPPAIALLRTSFARPGSGSRRGSPPTLRPKCSRPSLPCTGRCSSPRPGLGR
jgi:hypothetical protein